MNVNDESKAWANGFREGYEARGIHVGPDGGYTTTAGDVSAWTWTTAGMRWVDPTAEMEAALESLGDEFRAKPEPGEVTVSLTPEELDRMRHYHAARLKVSPEYLAELHVGEDRWTRRDLAAVDAFNEEEVARQKRRRRLVNAASLVGGLLAGSAIGWALVGWLF